MSRNLFVPFILILALTAAPAVPATPLAPAVVVVEIGMREFSFHPPVVHLTAGRPVQLRLRNQGQIAHQLQTSYLQNIESRVIDAALDVTASGLTIIRLEPGAAATLEFLPRRKGRFAFACTIEGHQEAGMRGFLEIR